MGLLKRYRKKQEKKNWRQPLGQLEQLGWRAGEPGRSETDRAFSVGAPDWPVTVDGPHYLDVIGAIQTRLAPEWYLEIGAFKGASLARCRGDYVAVDPQFQFSAPAPVARRAHLMQMTSEDFFASDFLGRNGIRPDLAFLDGLHLFEALLDDVIAAERSMDPGGVILLHDCLPGADAMEARDWADGVRFWAGDVWKVPLALLELRPDLKLSFLDAWPTGLVVLENLDPQNRALAEARDRLIAERRELRLSDYGRDAYFGRFEVQSAWRFLQGWRNGA